MKDKDSLYELCKQVYEATGWDTGHYFKPLKRGGRSSNYPPKYTSDYLLEKLPKEIDRWLLNGRYTFDWSFGYGSGLYFRNHSGSGDTPLKALLKLTIKLHEEKML